jgi:protein TonB
VITSEVSAPAAARQAPPPPVVRPDPLTPRIRESDDLHTRAIALVKKHGGRFSPGRPVPALPTAGYVRNSRPEPVTPVIPVASVPPADTGRVGAFVLHADEMDRVYAADPVYPASALRSGVEGWVELLFTITETGAVRDIEIVDAEPRGVFESAATQAVGNWRYRPRLANGQPVARRSYVTLRFNVDG